MNSITSIDLITLTLSQSSAIKLFLVTPLVVTFKVSAVEHLSASKYEVYLSFNIGYGKIWGRVTLLFF